jgi:hypothetical protein
MQARKSLVQLAQEIQGMKDSKHDFVVPSIQMGMYEGAITFGQDSFTPTEVFHDQLSAKLQIPAAYYKRMQKETPNLLESNVNTWLQMSDDRRMVRTVGGKARAFLSDRYRPLDNDVIMESVLPILAQQRDLNILSSELTDKRMYLQAVTPRLTGEVAVGDVVQMGLTISNSEVGLGSVRIEPLLYRLRCLNGAILATAMRRNHVGKTIESDGYDFYAIDTMNADNTAFLLKVRDTVIHSFDELAFAETLERVQITARNKIEAKSVQKVIVDVTKKYDFQKGEGESILMNLINGGDLSQWGLANAVTAMANDTENYDRAVEYERIGGRIIDLSPVEWTQLAA